MSKNNSEPQVPHPLVSSISIFLHDLAWRILQFALKAGLILFLWNVLIASAFSLPPLAFGNSFAIVAIVTILFSNLNGYSKFQTQHLFDLKFLLHQLIINQHTQNATITDLLSRSLNDSDKNKKIVSETEKSVDENAGKSYNTEESEK